MDKLFFGRGNAKLAKEIYTFSLPAGYTCPCALDCHSYANKKNGRISDGSSAKFRCYAASQETLYKTVRNSRWNNFNLLKQAKKSNWLDQLIRESIPADAQYIRIHVSGDFFSQEYFNAWVSAAISFPAKTFYAYTKCLHFWTYWIDHNKKQLPANLILTASLGGKYDYLIDRYNLKSARVVYSEREATDLGLQIDHDDSCAMHTEPKHFALLIHGIQPKGFYGGK